MQNNQTVNRFTDKMKSLFNEKLNEFNDFYSGLKKPRAMATNSYTDKIIFILPLSGRYETFLRFLNNFEDVSGSFKSDFTLDFQLLRKLGCQKINPNSKILT